MFSNSLSFSLTLSPQYHRSTMVSVWLVTLIAFILIVVDVKGWRVSTSNPAQMP